MNVTIDDLLVNLLEFEPVVNELELLDYVARTQFSFKDQLRKEEFLSS